MSPPEPVQPESGAKDRQDTARQSPAETTAGILATLVSSLVLEEVLANVARVAVESLDAWDVDIHIYDAEADRLTAAAHWCTDGVTDDDLQHVGSSFSVGERPDWRRTLEAHGPRETTAQDMPPEERAGWEANRYQTVLESPLVFADEVIGVLGVSETRRPRRFSDVEKDLFAQICQLAAIAIHNARKYRRQEEEKRRSQTLSEVGATLTSSLVLEEALTNVARAVGESIDAWDVDIHMYDAQTDRLTLVGSWCCEGIGDDELALIGTSFSIGERADWRILVESRSLRETFVDDDLPPEERAVWDRYGYLTVLEAPLVFADEIIGVLGISEKRRPRRFTDSERDLFVQLCHLAAIAINNARMYRRQEEEKQRSLALAEVRAALTSILDLDDVLAAIVQRIAAAFDVWECDLYEYDPARQMLIATASWSHEVTEEDRAWVGTEVDLRQRPTYRLILDDREIVETQIDDPDVVGEDRRLMEQWGELSALSAPLVYEDTVIGCLLLVEKRAVRRFSDEDQALLGALSVHASVALNNARVYRREQDQNKRLLALSEVGAALTSILDLDEVLSSIVQRIAEACDVWECDLYEYDPARRALVATATWAPEMTEEDRGWVGTVVDVSQRATLRQILEDRVMLETQIDDDVVDGEVRRLMEQWGELSVLSAPLVFEGAAIGCVELIEKRAVKRFSDQDKALLGALSVHASVALNNARTYRRQQDQSRRLAALVESSKAISSNVALEDVLNCVAEQAALALHSSECLFYEYLADSDSLVFRSIYPLEVLEAMDYGLGEVVALDDYPDDRTILAGGVAVLEQASDPDLAPAVRKSMTEWNEKTCLNVPLLFEGEPLGIMVLTERDKERDFTAAEIELITALGEQAAIVIHHARLFEGLQQRNAELDAGARRLRLLYEASAELSSSLNLENVLFSISLRFSHLLDTIGCDIFSLTDTGDLLCVASSVNGAPFPEWVGLRFPISKWNADRIALETLSCVVIDSPDDPRLSDAERELMSDWGETCLLIVPLIVKGVAIGTVELTETRHPRTFTPEEIATAEAVARMAALAIENARLFESQRADARRLASLVESGRAITSSVVLEEVLAVVAEKAHDTMGSSECSIYEYESETDVLIFRSIFPPSSVNAVGDPLGTAYPLAEHPIDESVVTTGVPRQAHVADLSLDQSLRDYCLKWAETATLSVPLLFENECLGIIVLTEHHVDRIFTDDEVQLMTALADQAAIAVNNARLYGLQEEQNRRLLMLLESSRGVTSTSDEQHGVEALKAELAELLGGGDTRVDVVVLPAEADAGDAGGPPEAPEDDLVAAAMSARRPQQADAGDGRRRLVIPLVIRDRPWGHVDIVGQSGRRFAQAEIEFATVVGNQAAAAIDGAHLVETIEQQAVVDRLTGLYDQSFFFSRLEAELARARRYRTPVSLLLCDVDGLKWFNDRLGHQAGDDVLRSIGHVLSTELRDSIDVPCRYGGGRFAVILPHTQLAVAQTGSQAGDDAADTTANGVAERLRRTIADTRFGSGDEGHQITVSVGIAAFPDHAVDADGLVAMADGALEQAKSRGGNCVNVAVI